MDHTARATARTPALVIYLVDCSDSMDLPFGEGRRIDIVESALRSAIESMIRRARKGESVSPRYRIAIYAYSEDVFDLLKFLGGGARRIDEFERANRFPKLRTLTTTNTAKAFRHAKSLLETEWRSIADCPAPLICHITDGWFTDEDPKDVISEIKKMRNSDGPVLVENIFINDRVLTEPITDVRKWPGILRDTPLMGEYADQLRTFSSPMPQSYRDNINERSYDLAPGSLMMFPGENAELVALGFQVTTMTPVG
ncbi:MAG: VWA domain-containing protein [Chloroflexota bacterium]|nr:MAG: VWA domain-containing protein [Chloroflexota bacterium]